MVGHSYLKTLLHLQAFSFKPSSSSSTTSSSMKIKTLIQTLIYAQFCRLGRAFSRAKSIAIQIYKENKPIQYIISSSKITKKSHKHNKLFFGSFRLHYNWCSSHVTPVPAPVLEGCISTTATATDDHFYYDSTWNSVIPTQQCDDHDDQDTVESELTGYLQWLEEKKANGNNSTAEINEIDKLAEMFIANSHEKFLLEKQESYRRFQEMMARSI